MKVVYRVGTMYTPPGRTPGSAPRKDLHFPRGSIDHERLACAGKCKDAIYPFFPARHGVYNITLMIQTPEIDPAGDTRWP